MNTEILSKEDLLAHWLGHRNLTKRTIESFPEEALFNFKVEGMRTFADMVKELLGIAVPGLTQIVSNTILPLNEEFNFTTKAALLAAWNEDTAKISDLYHQIPAERFKEEFNLFGQYNSPIIHSIFYFIDNENHHRAQGYVYLRSLSIVPPFFWERN